jgi:hypothetical protein
MTKRVVPILSALMLAGCAVVPAGGAAPPVPVLEIAVYQVRDPGAFGALQAGAHRWAAQQPGFVRSLRLQSAAEPTLFADVIEWRSLAEAKAAAQAMEQNAALAPFVGAIAQMKCYGHAPLTSAASPDLLDALARAPLVEIAVYAVKDSTRQDRMHARVHEKLGAARGISGHAPLKLVDADADYVDLIGWRAKEDHLAVGESMQKDPEVAPFFTNMGEMKVFDLFVVPTR